MSEENVGVVRSFSKAGTALMDKAAKTLGRRSAVIDLPEFSSLVEEYWHPQAVYDVSGRPDGGVYHGPGGFMQASRDWLAGWEDFDIELKELLSAGDRVVVVQDFRGTAHGGMEVELRDFSAVVTVRGGQFVRYQEFGSRAEALEAAGLSE